MFNKKRLAVLIGATSSMGPSMKAELEDKGFAVLCFGRDKSKLCRMKLEPYIQCPDFRKQNVVNFIVE